MGNGFGANSQALKKVGSGQNWTELLKPENGGPGDSPGRSEAVKRSLESVAEKRRRANLSKPGRSIAVPEQPSDRMRLVLPIFVH